ncbi:MAG: homocysteine S-methyltransferase family protein [Actinomycetota bacterium]
MSTTVEIDLMLTAIPDDDRPVWMAFAFPDAWTDAGVAIRSGEGPEAIAAAVAEQPRIEAVLVNCTTPEQTGEALQALRRALSEAGADVVTGAYANAFPTRASEPRRLGAGYRANNTILERRDDLTPDRYAEFVDEWVQAGATLLGGCCDMYPEHIAALADRFGR